jgi:hypothetical protein
MNWNQSFVQYAVQIAGMYKSHPDQILASLAFESVAGSLNETYQCLVKEKELTRMEDLPKEEKLKYWNRAKELSQDENQRVLICRSIYLLEKLTNE